MNTFQADPAVRQRMAEFLGGESLARATAVHLAHTDGCRFDRRALRPPVELDWFLERDLDVSRSLADHRSYLIHLDMEYVNFDSPAAAFVDPERCFGVQEPAVREIEALLLEWGIRPLHVVTGQGHHFVWRVDRESAVAERIRGVNLAPELIGPCLERMPRILSGSIGEEDQAAFAGIALMVEFLAHRIRERAGPVCELPVEITAVHVPARAGTAREMISVDISEYGDPLHTRVIRMPFSSYRKSRLAWLEREAGDEREIPRFRTIPLHEMDIREALRMRRDEGEVLDLARRACVRIPLQEEGTGRLLDDYLASRLRRFHVYFYSSRHDPKEQWHETYDRTPLEALPPCARHPLEHPNDLLLKPASMQLVTRCLLALGWHPRHIGGLIRSKFENPWFGWGVDWNDYEAATRADFYVRLFSCLYLAGEDGLEDFHCAAIKEKGFCFLPPECQCDFGAFRETLLADLNHE